MAKERFHMGYSPGYVWILDIPVDDFKRLDTEAEQHQHTIVKIRVGGMVSPNLGKIWAQQICDQLNQFDIANAAVAKLT